MSIIFKNVLKYFENQIVLDGLNLTIEYGSVYCLLGKNGAGKTTLINILSDYLAPNLGIVQIDGFDYNSNASQLKRKIGLISEGNSLIEELTGYEYLQLIGKLYDIGQNELSIRIKSLIDYFSMMVVTRSIK